MMEDFINDTPTMVKEKNYMVARILDLTVEIIYSITGEDYTVEKKSSGECMTPCVSGGWSRTQGTISGPPPHSLIHEQRVLELTHRITELLTGEVPIRCQEVAVYFSMEEWGYLARYKDRYKDVMMENPHLLMMDHFINDPLKMEIDKNYMAAKILDLTVEIVYSITGEDYTVVKKSSGESLTPCVSGGWSRTQGTISEPPPHSLIHEQRVLELTHRITELLTGEVPIRCQDVAVYFSMEECEYLEEHKEKYKDIIMEDHQSFTSPDGSSKRNPPERCPSPLNSQDCPEGKQNLQLDDQESSGGATRGLETITWVSVSGKDWMKDPHGHLLLPSSYELENNDSLIVKKTIGDGPGDIFACSGYGIYFKKTSNVSVHERIHTGERQFPCSECGKCYRHKSSLLKHERIHTGERPFTCSECGKSFTRKSQLVRHHSTHTEERPFPCLECGKCFARKSDLAIHDRIHTGEKPFSCSECGKSFSSHSNLVEHLRIHTGEKPFSCLECGKSFSNKSHLVRHHSTHTEERPFSCSDCGKCFSIKSNLVDHLRIHTGEKPFSCTVCGRCFTMKSSLIGHLRIHTGEKKFSCLECGKSFNSRSYLVGHQSTHTEEKPFSCSECGKGFSHKSSLVYHQRIHTGEKPNSCSYCGKCFNHKSSLVKHLRIHTGEKPFSCAVCGRCFTHRSSLEAHRRSHSGEKPL